MLPPPVYLPDSLIQSPDDILSIPTTNETSASVNPVCSLYCQWPGCGQQNELFAEHLLRQFTDCQLTGWFLTFSLVTWLTSYRAPVGETRTGYEAENHHGKNRMI